MATKFIFIRYNTDENKIETFDASDIFNFLGWKREKDEWFWDCPESLENSLYMNKYNFDEDKILYGLQCKARNWLSETNDSNYPYKIEIFNL